MEYAKYNSGHVDEYGKPSRDVTMRLSKEMVDLLSAGQVLMYDDKARYFLPWVFESTSDPEIFLIKDVAGVTLDREGLKVATLEELMKIEYGK